MERAAVVTCFLRHRGAILLLQRAADASTYPGRWGAVSGYVEEGDPDGTARTEICEETGLNDADLARAGEPFEVRDEALGRTWRIHPFLFDVGSRDVTLNEESTGAAWVSPTEILRRETVPALWTSYKRVAPSPATIAADDEHGSATLSVHALEALRNAAGAATVSDAPFGDVTTVARDLIDARPSMAALRNRVNRAMAGTESSAAVEQAAEAAIDRALEADEGAARTAADHIEGRVLTLSRSGTIIDALRTAEPAVVIAESRPAREGVGVAETLADDGLDVTLCTDASIAHVLAVDAMDAVIVGADTILPDGAVVNKTGTRAAALAADRENRPFYAVAAADKVSPDPELHLETGAPRMVYDGPADITVINPTFDVTPADLVDGYLTERGLLGRDDVRALAVEHHELAAWQEGEL